MLHSCASMCDFFDGECFREDLLGLIPMEGHTIGEILFTKIASYFEENYLDLARVNMLVTDGAHSISAGIRGSLGGWQLRLRR